MTLQNKTDINLKNDFKILRRTLKKITKDFIESMGNYFKEKMNHGKEYIQETEYLNKLRIKKHLPRLRQFLKPHYISIPHPSSPTRNKKHFKKVKLHTPKTNE